MNYVCVGETVIADLAKEITDMLNAPQIFGQDIHDTDYINWCRDTLNLDIEKEVKLKVKVEFI